MSAVMRPAPFLEFVECVGCSELFSIRSKYARKAKWCSERCRKQTLYSTPCVDCGAPVNGSDGRDAHRRCFACNGARTGQLARDRWAPYRAKIETLWAAGFTARQICEEVGRRYEKAALGKWRQRGYDLPYRRTGAALANIRRGNVGKFERARAMRKS